jgi:hypothetical protein
MGSDSSHICSACGSRFRISTGGGFFFDLLHCDRCGQAKSVGHEELGDIHLGYVKGLPGPYAVSRMELDSRIKQEFTGPVLSRQEYRQAAEATLGPCRCGGRFRYDAPARCPSCRSTSEAWDPDPTAPRIIYD